jgi:hypothetical protein
VCILVGIGVSLSFGFEARIRAWPGARDPLDPWGSRKEFLEKKDSQGL